MDLVRRHAELFNDGVRTGVWEPFAALFAEDATMEFVGVPVGPFRGRAAILDGYRAQPPDDEIAVGEPREEDGALVVPYAWASAPDVPAGSMHVVVGDGLLQHVTVHYGAP